MIKARKNRARRGGLPWELLVAARSGSARDRRRARETKGSMRAKFARNGRGAGSSSSSSARRRRRGAGRLSASHTIFARNRSAASLRISTFSCVFRQKGAW